MKEKIPVVPRARRSLTSTFEGVPLPKPCSTCPVHTKVIFHHEIPERLPGEGLPGLQVPLHGLVAEHDPAVRAQGEDQVRGILDDGLIAPAVPQQGLLLFQDRELLFVDDRMSLVPDVVGLLISVKSVMMASITMRSRGMTPTT